MPRGYLDSMGEFHEEGASEVTIRCKRSACRSASMFPVPGHPTIWECYQCKNVVEV